MGRRFIVLSRRSRFEGTEKEFSVIIRINVDHIVAYWTYDATCTAVMVGKTDEPAFFVTQTVEEIDRLITRTA